jgi:hypothetical protein
MWHIARSVTEAGVEGALDNLFGDRSWIVARRYPGLRDRIDILAEAFKAALGKTCTFVPPSRSTRRAATPATSSSLTAKLCHDPRFRSTWPRLSR